MLRRLTTAMLDEALPQEWASLVERAAQIQQVMRSELMPLGGGLALHRQPKNTMVVRGTHGDAYGVVGSDGSLHLGRIGEQGPESVQRVLVPHGFVADEDEVVTLQSVRHRLSDVHDIYLVLRRHPTHGPSTGHRVYRAEVRVAAGCVRVQQGDVDGGGGPERWLPVDLPESALPGFLTFCDFSFPPNFDPFSLDGRALKEEFDRVRAKAGVRCALVLDAERRLWCLDNDEVVPNGDFDRVLRLGGWPNCGAVDPGGHVYIGSSDRRIQRLDWLEDGTLSLGWSHRLTSEPLALSVTSRGDLLVATRDRRLDAFRHLGTGQLEQAWRNVVTTLFAGPKHGAGPKGALHYIEENIGRIHGRERRCAALVALCHRLARCEQFPGREVLAQVGRLAATSPFDTARHDFGSALGRLIESWARTETPRSWRLPGPNGLPDEDCAPETALVSAVYEHSPFEVRERIDDAVAALAAPLHTPSPDPAFRRLCERRQRTYRDLDGEGERFESLASALLHPYRRSWHDAMPLGKLGDFRTVVEYGPPGSPWILVAGRRGFKRARSAGGGPRRPSDWVDVSITDEVQRPVTLRQVSVVTTADGNRAAVIVSQGGQVRLEAVVGESPVFGTYRHPTPTRAVAWASAQISASPAGGELVILWEIERRHMVERLSYKFLEGRIELRRTEGNAYHPLGFAARNLAVCRTEETDGAGFRLFLTDGEHNRLAVRDWTSEGDLRDRPDVGLSAPCRPLVSDSAGRVFAGTEDGLVWALDADGHVEWITWARRGVRNLAAHPDGPRERGIPHIIVVSESTSIVVLDAFGHRIWRTRFGSRPLHAGFRAPHKPGEWPAILVMESEGVLAEYEPTGPFDPARSALVDAALPPGISAEAKEARLVAGEDLVAEQPILAEIHHRATRHAFVERLAMTPSTPPSRREAELRRANSRELASLVGHPTHPPTPSLLALVAEVLAETYPKQETFGDEGRRAWAAAVGEALRATPGTSREQVLAFLHRLPAEAWDERFPAVMAAQAWWRAVRGEGVTPLGALLTDLLRLPPRVIEPLAWLSSGTDLHRVAAPLGRLCVAVDDRHPERERLDALRACSAAFGGVGGAGVAPFRALLAYAGADERDEDLRALLALISLSLTSAVAAEGSLKPIFAWLRGLAPEGLPDDSWRLDRRLAWLAVLEQRAGLDIESAPLVAWLGERVTQRVRQGAAAHRETLERRPGVHVAAFDVTRAIDGRMHVHLTIQPEAVIEARDVHTEVNCRVGAVAEVRRFHRQVWRTESPPETLEFDFADVSSEQASVTIRVRGRRWNVDVQRQARLATGSVPSAAGGLLGALPLWRARLINRVVAAARDAKWVIVSLVPTLGADAVVSELRTRVDVVRSLDPVLREYGPGRLYPDRFSAAALLQVVAPPSTADACRLALLESGDDTFARVLQPAHAAVWAALDREVATGRFANHRFVVVLSPHLASRLAARLGERCRLVNAALHTAGRNLPLASNDPTVDELVDHLAEAYSMGRAFVRFLVRIAAGDLRVFATGTPSNREPAALAQGVRELGEAYASADFAELSARDGLALYALARTATRLAVRKLRPGLILAESVRGRLSRSSPDSLIAQEGAALTRKHLRQLQAAGVTSALVRGTTPDWEAGEGADRALLNALDDNPARVLGRLRALGLVDEDAGGLITVIEPLARHLRRVLAAQSQPGIADLVRRRDPLEGVPLDRLDRLDWSPESPHFAAPPTTEQAEAVFAVARLWQGQNPVAQLAALARVVVGGPTSKTAQTQASTFVGGAVELHFLSRSTPTPTPLHVLEPGTIACVFGPDVETREEEAIRARFIPKTDTESGRRGELAVLYETHLREVLGAADPKRALQGVLRACLGMKSLSPFRTSGSLPPGSPVFVGREETLAEIAQSLTTRSTLILGARQVGKTSLLNQAMFRASRRSDVLVAHADCQGLIDLDALPQRLRIVTPGCPVVEPNLTAETWFRRFADIALAMERIPVVFLNEVHEVLRVDARAALLLRGLGESGLRFVMVGYPHLGWAVRDPSSPLFHFTGGPHEGKIVRLAALSQEEGRSLMARLLEPPLGLLWAANDRVAGERRLMEASHGIPWVLQSFCDRLVRRLHDERRATLTADDCHAVVAATPRVLEHLDRMEVTELLSKADRPAAADIDAACTAAIRLITTALAERLYFGPDLLVDAEDLPERAPCAYGFTEDDARLATEAAVARYAGDGERPRVLDYLRRFPVGKLLDALGLTLMLADCDHDVGSGLHRYAFAGHVFPIELRRAMPKTSPADRIYDSLSRLLRALTSTGAESKP
ncbi:hypothetical protein L6V77_26465 [Myxococcota bacterium]|nr:hypothetical protein [Myxococcota bacterium]